MTPPERKVLDAVGELARHLPSQVVERLCLLLEKLPAAPTAGEVSAIPALLVDKEARSGADRAVASWRANAPHLSPQTLAWMLRSAASADAWRSGDQSIEPVWTGPGAPLSSLRRTDAALIEVIESAQERLWIVTFAAYLVAPVMAALKRAAERGVKIYFVGESSSENEALSSGGVSALRAHLPGEVVVYIWPQGQRPLDEKGNAGTLHAKVAVADGKVALVSSANLTNHALLINIEAGALVRGGTVPTALELQLTKLISAGILIQLT